MRMLKFAGTPLAVILGLKPGKTALKYAPIVGPAVGLIDTAMKVYNSTDPTTAMMHAAKGILIDCTPPVIRFPFLCGGFGACLLASIATGHPYAIAATSCMGQALVESFG